MQYFPFSAEPEQSCTPSTLGFSEPAEKNKILSKFWRFRNFQKIKSHLQKVRFFMSFRGILFRGPQKILVLLGKRSTQAKEWALSSPTMRFQKRSVRRVCALAWTCKEPRKSIKFSPFWAGIFFGVPAGYCVPVGHMVAFLQCVIRNNRGPRGILCTRGDKWHQNSDVLEMCRKIKSHLFKVGFFYFFEDTCVFGAFVLVFFWIS